MHKKIKRVALRHFLFKERACIAIIFDFDVEIMKAIDKLAIESLAWSTVITTWYVFDENNNLERILEVLNGIAVVDYNGRPDNLPNSPFRSKRDNYSSVFISYSFKDKEFAAVLNEALNDHGIDTFLWEKDAPFGKPLKEIMIENVNRFDRILFIASEHSIRSNACQFELSSGREKQEKLWNTIFFPIHIDNYLFEVQKEKIRPLDKVEEYWQNIKELREINSADFTEFNDDSFDENVFEEKIRKLIDSLKIK